MLPDDDITWLGLEIVVKSASPGIFREDLARVPRQLIGGGVFPAVVLSWLPSAVGYKEDTETTFPGSTDDGAQVVEQADLSAIALPRGKSFPPSLRKSVQGSTSSTAVNVGSEVGVDIELSFRE